jgi:DNA-binding winged helix-turn-helix (wHTH) protein
MDRHDDAQAGDGSREPALLIWRDGELVKDQWRLDRPSSLIGRTSDCHVHLENRWISRIYARVVRQGISYRLEDAGSRNGVFLNGKRVTDGVDLRDGDRVQLAPGLELLFVDSESTWPLPRSAATDLALYRAERSVLVQGQPIMPPLSAAQHDLLALLVQEPGRVYSRAEVVGAVWPGVAAEGVSDDAVDALVRRVRQRLQEIDAEREYILTVRGYGFKLNPELRVESG